MAYSVSCAAVLNNKPTKHDIVDHLCVQISHLHLTSLAKEAPCPCCAQYGPVFLCTTDFCGAPTTTPQPPSPVPLLPPPAQERISMQVLGRVEDSQPLFFGRSSKMFPPSLPPSLRTQVLLLVSSHTYLSLTGTPPQQQAFLVAAQQPQVTVTFGTVSFVVRSAKFHECEPIVCGKPKKGEHVCKTHFCPSRKHCPGPRKRR